MRLRVYDASPLFVAVQGLLPLGIKIIREIASCDVCFRRGSYRGALSPDSERRSTTRLVFRSCPSLSSDGDENSPPHLCRQGDLYRIFHAHACNPRICHADRARKLFYSRLVHSFIGGVDERWIGKVVGWERARWHQIRMTKSE